MDIELNDDDEYLDDNDLDDLPDDTFSELERRAVFSTQQQQQQREQEQYKQRAITQSVVIGPTGQAEYAVKSNGATLAQDAAAGATEAYGHHASSDYGFEEDDDDVIDLDAQPPRLDCERHHEEPKPRYTAESQSRASRPFVPPRPAVPNRPTSQASSANGHTPRSSYAGPSQPSKQSAPTATAQGKDVEVIALQARIQELERERNNLLKNSEDAKAAVVSKTGEIAIVRSNHEKAAKEYERRLTVMEKLHTEEVARQKVELEAARKEREKIETNNKFLEHDLAQEAEKARKARQSLKDGHGNVTKVHAGKPGSPLSTPKKNKPLPFRDGFDDDEVMFVSPSKSKDKPKDSTPKAGAKRKRPTEQSPLPPLPFAELEGLAVSNGGTPSAPNALKVEIVQESPHQKKARFMRSLIDHRIDPDEERTLELMATYSFPSFPKKSLSSFLYDRINILWTEETVDKCRASFCDELMTLWSRCLDEKYYAPLYNLTELSQWIFLVSPSALATSCIPRLVPLCLATADLIAVPTARASKSPSSFEPPRSDLKSQIDPFDYLGFLDLLTLSCAAFTEHLTTFWTAVEYDFVLVMLNRAQPLSQISSMLMLLNTSILPESFGAIAMTPAQQQKHESDTIDRLTVLLFETLQVPEDEEPYTATELLELRTSILALFRSLCSTKHGGNLLATHRLFIGRLVRLLHESIVALYAYKPATHALTTQLVNESVLILAHLTACYPDVVDMRARLAAVPGGTHKHLVSLSRIAFADGVGLIEQGIDGEAAEAAHRMLDEWLSPEEGEAVVSVFSTAR